MEVKMDDLHRKLDQLLTCGSRGSCPMCTMCTKHSRQQDATTSQLSAQAKLLEDLERKVTDLRNALEELTQGLEGRTTDKMSVPLAVLRRRKSLPVRTSADEVYVQLEKIRDQKIIQHTFNAPCGKGREDILIEDTEDEGMRHNRTPLRNAENKSHDPKSDKEDSKDSKMAHRWATAPTEKTAKNSDAKSSLGLNSFKNTEGVAGFIAGGPSKTDTLTVPSKINIPPPNVTTPLARSPPPNVSTPLARSPPPNVSTPLARSPPPNVSTPLARSPPPNVSTPLARSPPPNVTTPLARGPPPNVTTKLARSPPPLEIVAPKPKMSPSPPVLETPLPKIISPPKKDGPCSKIPMPPPPPPPPPKITQASVPFKATVFSTSATPTQTSVAGSPLTTNQKIPALWTTTASPTVVTSTSGNPPRLNVTENAAPPSSVHSLQKGSSLGHSVVMSRCTSPVLEDSKTSHPNGSLTKLIKTRDELVPPNITGSPFTSLVSTMSNSPAESPATENITPSHTLPKTPSSNAPTTKSLAVKSSVSSPRTPSAATAFLQHVYSCPDSLQSLKDNAGKTEPATAVQSRFQKSGKISAGNLKHGGIQIKISPAPEKTTSQNVRMAAKTCFKIIDDVPPQPAPFSHRCVSLRSSPPSDFSIHTREVLGGGRFGKVHKCTDVKTGLRLAAKIISTRTAKEREMVLNEIEVMNQLSHTNVLQLFDAFEMKNQVVLILEYLEGGELFERIVDESCPLTEVDAMVFVKQICQGVQYMHQMYVLHLDLKPENILCLNRSSHQIKIIDFGLARRYKPREKLRVSFGTPEFLAPEVVNFDFVSFPTDMWTLGVVTYMLLSGLSPFLGDDDSETLNNVLTVNWYFDDETFEHVSAEAKDFISNLLIKERGGRLSAAQCLKHPWLNNISEKAKSSNIVLKSQVLLKKYMARRLWKKNYIAIAAANRFKKIGSSGSLTSLGI